MKYYYALLALACSLTFLAACNPLSSTSRLPSNPSTEQTSNTSTKSGAVSTTPSTSQQTSKATPAPLSPARNLVGTWKTPFPVKFFIQTDFRNLEGNLEDAASLDRTMTWVITATGNENEVNIECHATDSNIQQVAADPPVAYTPDVFPIGFTGNIMSSSRLITPMGEFTFTNDIISGTWDHTEEVLYSQREFTQSGALKLTRQSNEKLMPVTSTTSGISSSRFASLMATDAVYQRMSDAFKSCGYDFDTLYQ
jgi:hypothetical protein